MLDSVDDSASRGRHPLLLVGPAGGGKTAFSLRKVAEVLQRNPLARVWVVVATREQQRAFQHRLLDEPTFRRSASIGVEVMDFHALCQRIVDLIDIPPRRVSPSSRLYLLRRALAEVTTQAALEHYSSISHTRGFARAVLGLIGELQGNGVPAAVLVQSARTGAERDLGRIYTAYSSIMAAKGLCDESSIGRLALEALGRYPAVGTRIDLLVVDGFDRLGQLKLALLEILGQRAREALFTLTYSPARVADAHRHFSAPYEGLIGIGCTPIVVEASGPTQASCPDPSSLDEVVTRPRKRAGETAEPCQAQRAIPLRWIEANLFAIGQQVQLPAEGAVAVLEAPDELQEVQAVARRVKRLVLDGVDPEEVAVLVRPLSTYGPLCREVFREFGIPFTVLGGSCVAGNPAVATVLDLLSLAEDRFPRARTVELLRSPYVLGAGLTPEQVDILERVSRERVVVRGREQWLDALVRPAGALPGSGVEEDADRPSSVLDELSGEAIEELRNGLEGFLDRITPPSQGSPHELVRWVEGIIGVDPEELRQRAEEAEQAPEESGGLVVVVQARRGTAETGRRDIAALCGMKMVLAGILAGNELVDPDRAILWAEFRQDLLDGCRAETFDSDPARGGRVVVCEVEAQRGVPRDHVFLLGMSDGNFPRRLPQGNLLSLSDRVALVERGIHVDIPDPSGETALFYEMLSLPRRSLTLSYPYLDESGNPWPASPYIREVYRLLSGVEVDRKRLGSLPPPGEASSLGELLLSAGEGSSSWANVAAEWMSNSIEAAGAWVASLRGKAVEGLREGRGEKGVFGGVLADPALLEAVAQRLGDRRVWSVSQFDEYAQCPFLFFARRMLSLELAQEPEEGINPLHLGTINHRVLELTYGRITEAGLALNAEELPRIRRIFEEVAEEVLRSAPTLMGFRPTAWWRHEREDIARRLWRLIELDATQSLGVELLRQEAKFGFGEAGGPTLVLEGPAGRLRVRGKIDRIDRVGNGYRVIDYKTGSTRIAVEDQSRGRNSQMQVYLLATKALLWRWGLPEGPISGLFWHIRDGATSGHLTLDDARVETAREIIHRNVIESRKGRFPAHPSKMSGGRCAVRCDFGNLCRGAEVASSR